MNDRAHEALTRYDRAIERLRAGDWAASARNSARCDRSLRSWVNAPAVVSRAGTTTKRQSRLSPIIILGWITTAIMGAAAVRMSVPG